MKRMSSSISRGFFLAALLLLSPLYGDWTKPVTLSGPLSDNARVAVDASGNAVAVWQEMIGPNILIQASTHLFKGSWTAPVSISTPGENATNPDVAVDPSGNAVAVWQRFDGTHQIVQGATLPFGGAWTTPVNISVAGEDAIDAHVGVDAAGDAVAVWNRFNGTNQIVQSSSLPFHGVWTTPVNISGAGLDSNEPRVAVDVNGNAVVVFRHFNGTNFIIQAANKMFSSATWTAPTGISVAGQNADNPQVAVDAEGDAAFVFSRFNGINTVVQGVVQPFFDTFSGATNLPILQQDSSNPDIALSPAGNGVAVWIRFDGSNTIVQAATITALNLSQGRSIWTAAVNVSEPGEDATHPKVSMDASSNAIAIWSRASGIHTVIQSASLPFNLDSSWSTPINVSAKGRDGVKPYVAADPSGNAVAVWEESQGTSFVVQASTIKQFFRPEPPKNLTVRQILDRFLTQTDVVNQLHWRASTDVRVVSYNIYRNNELIGNVSATAPVSVASSSSASTSLSSSDIVKLIFNDHGRKRDKKEVYKVTAVLSNGVESLPVTVTIN